MNTISPSLDIKTGSERENCYRFCRILVDIGNAIARGYVERVITNNFGYKDINEFFNINENLIREFPDKCGYYNKRHRKFMGRI